MRAIEAINRIYETAAHGLYVSRNNMAWHDREGKNFEEAHRMLEDEAQRAIHYVRNMQGRMRDLEEQLELVTKCKNSKTFLAELTRYQKELGKARSRADEATDVREELSDQQKAHAKQLQALQDKILELSGEVKKAQSEAKGADALRTAAQAERNELQSEHIDVKRERDQALVRVGSLTMEVESLRAEVATLRPARQVGKSRRKLDLQSSSQT